MPIQVGSSSARKPVNKNAGGGLKPWHIALMVVAVLLIGWQVFSFTRQSAQANQGEFVKTPPQAAAPNPGKPGTGTSRMYEEKDRE
jgi:hypothetical protein